MSKINKLYKMLNKAPNESKRSTSLINRIKKEEEKIREDRARFLEIVVEELGMTNVDKDKFLQ